MSVCGTAWNWFQLSVALFLHWRKSLCIILPSSTSPWPTFHTFTLHYHLIPWIHLQHQYCLQVLRLLKPPLLPLEVEPLLPPPTTKPQLPVFHRCHWRCFEAVLVALKPLWGAHNLKPFTKWALFCFPTLLYISGYRPCNNDCRKWFGLNCFGKQKVFVTEKDVFTLESALTTNSGLVLVSGIHSQVSIFLYVMPFAVVVFFVGFFIYYFLFLFWYQH